VIDVRRLSDEEQKIYKISHPNDDETKGVIFTLEQARIIINSTFSGGAESRAVCGKAIPVVELSSWLSKFHETYPDLSLKLSG
jgi:hypothetical protein